MQNKCKWKKYMTGDGLVDEIYYNIGCCNKRFRLGKFYSIPGGFEKYNTDYKYCPYCARKIEII